MRSPNDGAHGRDALMGLGAKAGLACLGAVLVTAVPRPGWTQGLAAGAADSDAPRTTEMRVVFAERGDQVEMHVQARFEGAVEPFGWLVPVATADPDSVQVESGSWSFFELLAEETGPRVRLERKFDPTTCNVQPRESFGCGPTPAPAVIRVDSEEVSMVAPSVRSSDPESTFVLSAEQVPAWLSSRNLQQVDLPSADNLRFVAVEVQPDASTGWIEPIVLRYRASDPVLAFGLDTPSVPVRVWLFSDARGVPAQAPIVTPNLEHLDWFEGSNEYMRLIEKALTEAGSDNGWIQEHAGSTARLRAYLIPESGFGTRDSLAGIEDARRFVAELERRGFAFDAVLLDVLRSTIAYPEAYRDAGVTPDEFHSHPLLYLNSSDADRVLEDDVVAIRASQAAATIWQRIVEPARNAQELITGSAQISRLLTLRARDAGLTAFTYRALPIGPQRGADYVQSCRDDGSSDGGWLTLEDGRTFFTDRSDWPDRDRRDVPFVVRIERVSEDGTTVVVDNTDRITPSDPPDAADGCRSVGPSNLTLWGLVVAAWALRARVIRRRLI